MGKISGAKGYKVLRSEDGENYSEIASAVTNEYTDNNVPKYNKAYYYSIITVFNDGSKDIESLKSSRYVGIKNLIIQQTDTLIMMNTRNLNLRGTKLKMHQDIM